MPLELTERFVRQYAKLPRAVQRKVDKALRLLEADFRHQGLQSYQVESATGIFEAYVDSKYRVTFERRRDVFVMRNVDSHDECLRKP